MQYEKMKPKKTKTDKQRNAQEISTVAKQDTW